MQQRQLRLGDILDDYCPRERRVTNHAVVAMVGADVKQTRCTTCEAEHEDKEARVPRQRRKADAPAALYAQVLASGPKRVVPESAAPEPDAAPPEATGIEAPAPSPAAAEAGAANEPSEDAMPRDDDFEEGPVHRPLIRATLPRPEGQPPPQRPAPSHYSSAGGREPFPPPPRPPARLPRRSIERRRRSDARRRPAPGRRPTADVARREAPGREEALKVGLRAQG